MNVKIIDKDLKIKLGQMITVQNQNKKIHERDTYIAIQVEDECGTNERCILFTELELSDIRKIQSDVINNNLITGRIYSIKINNKQQYIIKLLNRLGQELVVRLTKRLLNVAEQRALRNKEDLTKKGFFTDLID